MQTKAGNEMLYQIAGQNYKKLVSFCELLDLEGYWKTPSELLKKTIIEMLDLYLQSFLVQYACQYNRLDRECLHFMITLPEYNVLQLSEPKEQKEEKAKNKAPEAENTQRLPKELFRQSQKVCQAPPILLQLCGLRDKEKCSRMSCQFYDAAMNVLLSFSHLNHGVSYRDLTAAHFIEEYFEQVKLFLDEAQLHYINESYIYKKARNERIRSEFSFEFEPENKCESYGSASALREEPPESFVLRPMIIKDVEPECEAAAGQKPEGLSVQPAEPEQEFIVGQKPEDLSDQNFEQQEEAQTPGMVKKADFINQKLKEEQVKEIQEQIRQIRERKSRERFDALMEELNQLVGLEQVKEEIRSLVNLIRMRKLRASFDMPDMEISYHMVFTGSPGTGKTTVARLMSRIYKELGILSKGTLVETDRAGLVAGYVGQTALKVTEVVQKARGGVLFIDEAYALTNSSVPNDFGTEAVDTLVKLMEDYREDFVVIVAGYQEEMKTFLASNPGLISRFNKFIEFQDYSQDELVDILAVMAKKAGVELTEEAKKLVCRELSEMEKEQQRLFGNARGIRNAFEKMIQNQANRIMKLDAPTKEDLSQIIAEDVKRVLKSVPR